MTIFTNESTYPFERFLLLDDKDLTTYSDIKKFNFVLDEEMVLEAIIKQCNILEMQHLFLVVTINVLRITFNANYRYVKKSEISSSSIKDNLLFINLLNLRLDLEELEGLVLDLQENPDVKIDRKQLLKDIILFTYKFLFVKFGELIYCNLIDDFMAPMEFTYQYNKFLKFKDNLYNKKCTEANIGQHKHYIKYFNESFKLLDQNNKNKTIEELLIFSDSKKGLSYLNGLLEKSIVINNDLSATKKNKILLPFYRSVICLFYFPLNHDLDLDDPLLIKQHKKFRHSRA